MRLFIGGGIGLLHRLGGQVFGQQPAEVDVQIIGHNTRMDNPQANPLANNAPNFNYGANGFNNPGANNKPPYVPLPPPEPGFTRCTGEELDMVCGACEETLAYDPKEERPPSRQESSYQEGPKRASLLGCQALWSRKPSPPPSPRGVLVPGLSPRTNLASIQVFCRDCYETRMKADKTWFRHVKTGTKKQVLCCATDNCDSEVTSKGAWVGIFL